jgi:hypothetical protein
MKPGGRKCTAGSSWSWKTAAVKKLLARSEAGALRYYSPSDKLGSLRASGRGPSASKGTAHCEQYPKQ